MSNIAIDLKSEKFEFFNNGVLNYFLPEICSISETQKMDLEFTHTGLSYVFSIYLTHKVAMELGFENEQEAGQVRKDLITALSKFWGPDKLVYNNGFDCEIAVIPAILDVTDVFAKGSRFSFSATVDSTPYPVNFIFYDEREAKSHHKNLLDAIETHRRQSCAAAAEPLTCGCVG